MSARAKQELPPGLEIRAGRYHYRFMVAGHRYSGPTGYEATARNLTPALRKLAAARRLVESGQEELLKLSPKPFSDAARDFISWAEGESKAHPATAARLETSMVSCKVFFDRTPLHTVTAGSLEDYKDWRRSQGIREITLRHDLHALSKLYQYGMKHRWCHHNAVKDVKIPSDKDAIRQHVLTDAEEEAYFLAAQPGSTLFDGARLILLTGMRPEEVLGLEQSSVSLEHRTIFVARGKTDAARRVLALVPEAAAILQRRLAKPGHWVFPGHENRAAQKRMNSAHDRALHHYNHPKEGPAPELQLTHVLYDLRHTFATRMAEAGCPLPVLAAILGHANLRTIHRYVHIRPQAQQEAMLRYAEMISGACKIGASAMSKTGVSEGPGGRETMISARKGN